MRDGKQKISENGARQLASLFSDNLAELIKIFRLFRHHQLPIPPSCAIEMQHICMHMAALTEPNLSRELASSHFQSAVGHSKRALLDAYKEFIFIWKRERDLAWERQKDFAHCRAGELREGFTGDYLNTLARYRELLNSILNGNSNITIIKCAEPNIDTELWKIVKVWLELDLLISALSKEPDKSSISLQQLLQCLIFPKDNHDKTSCERLREATIQQKVKIITLLFTNNELLEDFIAKNRGSESDIAAVRQTLKDLSHSGSRNFQEFEELCDSIFPLISSYFELAYSL